MPTLLLTTALLVPQNVGASDQAVFVKPTALPFAPDSSIQFQKAKLFTYDTAEINARMVRSLNPTIAFERQRAIHGAITPEDLREREGNYFTFFWKTARPADVTVRFEYRVARLGAHVQAQEVRYQGVQGSRKTHFSVTGDDYFNDGRVIAWRALLIENGRTVAVKNSYLWK